jgi:hypothetical protein
MMIWIFAGILVGPSLFALAYNGIGSYTTTFGFLAAAGVASAVLAVLAARTEPRT